jgi:hypothetical protein
MGIVLHIKWIDFAIKHVGNQPKKSISSFAIERLYATGVAYVDGAVCDNMCVKTIQSDVCSFPIR